MLTYAGLIRNPDGDTFTMSYGDDASPDDHRWTLAPAFETRVWTSRTRLGGRWSTFEYKGRPKWEISLFLKNCSDTVAYDAVTAEQLGWLVRLS